jgi:hypothetical protein
MADILTLQETERVFDLTNRPPNEILIIVPEGVAFPRVEVDFAARLMTTLYHVDVDFRNNVRYVPACEWLLLMSPWP